MSREQITPEQFCYWLQGMFEGNQFTTLSEKQISIIKEHLSLVFTKITPDHEEVFLEEGYVEEEEVDELVEKVNELLEEISKRDTPVYPSWPDWTPQNPYTAPSPHYTPSWPEIYCSASADVNIGDEEDDGQMGLFGASMEVFKLDETDEEVSSDTVEKRLYWTPEDGIMIVTEDWYRENIEDEL